MPPGRKARKGSLIVASKVDFTGGNRRAFAFDVLYKGDRVASAPSGVDTIREVLAQFDDYETIGKKVSSKESKQIADAEGCAVVVTADRIMTVHKKRQDRLQSDVPRSISFVCTLPHSKEYETFAYISQNLKLNMCRAHIYLCTNGDGAKIVQAFKKAKLDFEDKSDREMSNPFAAPPNAPREVPKGLLFNKQIHRSDLKALEVIGSGQFGAVYLATQVMRKCPVDGKLFAIDGHLKRYMEDLAKKGQTAPEGTRIEKLPVVRAVKMLKGSATPAAKKEFLREAEVMLMFEHENVTVIQGVAVQQAPWLYVLEFCQYGDLRQVLKTCMQRKFPLRSAELLHLCIGVLAGMEHIASKGCIHLDLAARNCLLGENNVVKVADFGLTRKLGPGETIVTLTEKGLKLAIKWLPPESLKKRCFSQASDIWAFGITCWELYAYGKMPYDGLNNDETQKMVLKGEIMDRPKACPPDAWELIAATMKFAPGDRSSFRDHRRKFEALKAGGTEEVREIGKMLNDPALEKAAKAAALKRSVERKQQAVEAMKQRTNLIFEASKEQGVWWQQMIGKEDAEKLVLSNPVGSFVLRQDAPERMILVVNEQQEASQYPIKIDLAEDGKNVYVFGGKAHKNPAEIIGNLRFAPFKGRLGQPLKLTVAAKGGGKRSSSFRTRSSTDPTGSGGGGKGNPLFQDDDGADGGFGVEEESL